MRKSLAVFLLAAFAALASPTAQLVADVVLPVGLAPGSQYQLIFATADLHDGVNTDINGYNGFVSSEAALGVPFGLPSGLTWDAVVSTAAVNANANAVSGALPVYNTAGQEVTAPGVGIYTGVLDNLVQYDQFGGIETAAQTNNLGLWTGSNFQGFGVAGNTLGGGGNAEIGRFALDSTWLQFGTRLKSGEVTFSRPMYALSGPITVPTPEPAAITLLVSALLAIGGHCFLRWRRAGR
jgi:hypothetical protein